MRRREFVTALGVAATWPFAAPAQQRRLVPRADWPSLPASLVPVLQRRFTAAHLAKGSSERVMIERSGGAWELSSRRSNTTVQADFMPSAFLGLLIAQSFNHEIQQRPQSSELLQVSMISDEGVPARWFFSKIKPGQPR